MNVPFPDILSWLGKASIGLSATVDENFGINVVEIMVRVGCVVPLFLKLTSPSRPLGRSL